MYATGAGRLRNKQTPVAVVQKEAHAKEMKKKRLAVFKEQVKKLGWDDDDEHCWVEVSPYRRNPPSSWFTASYYISRNGRTYCGGCVRQVLEKAQMPPWTPGANGRPPTPRSVPTGQPVGSNKRKTRDGADEVEEAEEEDHSIWDAVPQRTARRLDMDGAGPGAAWRRQCRLWPHQMLGQWLGGIGSAVLRWLGR